MSLRTCAHCFAHALCLISLAATAQPLATDLRDQEIRDLIAGKRLELRFAGAPPTSPNFLSHWNFRADGSLCARLIGSGPQTGCAEVGRWRTQSNTLCWQLTTIGTTTGINASCGWVRKVSGEAYEIVDVSGKLGSTAFSIGK